MRILVLHQLDAMWWSHVTPYEDEAAVEDAPDLVSLPLLERDGASASGSPSSPRGCWAGAATRAMRRFSPRVGPRCPG